MFALQWPHLVVLNCPLPSVVLCLLTIKTIQKMLSRRGEVRRWGGGGSYNNLPTVLPQYLAVTHTTSRLLNPGQYVVSIIILGEGAY